MRSRGQADIRHSGLGGDQRVATADRRYQVTITLSTDILPQLHTLACPNPNIGHIGTWNDTQQLFTIDIKREYIVFLFLCGDLVRSSQKYLRRSFYLSHQSEHGIGYKNWWLKTKLYRHNYFRELRPWSMSVALIQCQNILQESCTRLIPIGQLTLGFRKYIIQVSSDHLHMYVILRLWLTTAMTFPVPSTIKSRLVRNGKKLNYLS